MITSHWWFKFFFVMSAVVIGVWIPVHLLYIPEAASLDLAIDALTIVLVGGHYLFRWQTRNEKDADPLSKASLFVDLLIAIPFDLLAQKFLGRSIPELMLLKILLLRRLSYVKELFDVFASLHPIVYRLIPVAFFLPILVHLVSCLWISVGSGTAGPDPNPWAEYTKALYWTITTLTTVGYGDISANTPIQMLVACGTQVLGVGVFGFILSNVAAVLARLDAARDHHLSTLDRVETFMRYNKLPTSLRAQIREYYRYIWENHRGYDDSEILESLPGHLRGKVSLALNQDVIESVPIFNGADRELLQDVVMNLSPRVCVPGERIFLIDEVGDAMYFIQAGQVDILDRSGKLIATLSRGAFFGEAALINDSPRSATARVRNYCDLYVLSRDVFNEVIHRHPHFEGTLKQTIANRSAS